MSLKIRAARASLIVLIGNAVSYGSSFVRNMILARLLSKADFGAGATLSLVLGLLELTAKTGVARFVVQDKDGDKEELISTVHSVQLLIGSISAFFILAGSPFFSSLFKIPGPSWVTMFLALVPMLRAMEHADVRRYQRELRFLPSVGVEAIPQVIITIAAWPVTIWVGDFKAVLILIIAKSFFSCVFSHIFAERPYRLSWVSSYAKSMFYFGWPLILTGFLMFGVLQGDQFLVATFYSLSDLGPYAAAATLALIPGFFFGDIFGGVFLPVLAKVQSDGNAFLERYRVLMALTSLVSGVVGVGMVVGAEGLMGAIYGSKYLGSGTLLAFIASAHAFRNVRIATTTAALAKADSKNSLISNVARVLSLIPATWCALSGYPVWTIAACGLMGEAFACWISFSRIQIRDGVPFRESLRSVGVLCGLLVSAGLIFGAFGQEWNISYGLVGGFVAAFASGIFLIAGVKELRREAKSILDGVRKGGWKQVWNNYRLSQ